MMQPGPMPPGGQAGNAMPPGAPAQIGFGGGVSPALSGAVGAVGAMGAPPMPPPQVPDNIITIDKVMRLLRDNAHRKFRVDIETDSTIAGDEAQEKTDRSELIASITKMVETWGPIVTAKPMMADLAGELMLFGVRAFRVGRSLETVIEETVEKLKEEAGLPKPPPEPSPDELIKAKTAQIKGQAEIQKAQIDAQVAKIDAQARIAEVQLQTHAAAQDHVQTLQQGQQQAALADQKARNDAASQEMKAEIETMRFEHAVETANKPAKG